MTSAAHPGACVDSRHQLVEDLLRSMLCSSMLNNKLLSGNLEMFSGLSVRLSVSPPKSGEVRVFSPITLHSGSCEVRYMEKSIRLTKSEFGILRILAQKPGWVYSRYEIVDLMHGTDYAVSDRSIDFHLYRMRQKLGNIAECIETVRGAGYRLKDVPLKIIDV